MANKLTEQKRTGMFTAFCERQSIEYVARKCGVSPTTVRRYRALDNWDNRWAEIRLQAQKKVDMKLAEQTAKHIKTAEAAIDLFAQSLVGQVKESCPQCGTQVIVSIPKTTISASDFDRLVRLVRLELEKPDSRPATSKYEDLSDQELREKLRDLERLEKTS